MSDFKALDRLLQGYVDNGLPGCSCMIARRGEILYENYFGYSDVEPQIPLSAQNVFLSGIPDQNRDVYRWNDAV